MDEIIYEYNGKTYTRKQLELKYGDKTDEAIAKFGMKQSPSKKEERLEPVKLYEHNGREYTREQLELKYGDKTDRAIAEFGFKERTPVQEFDNSGKEEVVAETPKKKENSDLSSSDPALVSNTKPEVTPISSVTEEPEEEIGVGEDLWNQLKSGTSRAAAGVAGLKNFANKAVASIAFAFDEDLKNKVNSFPPEVREVLVNQMFGGSPTDQALGRLSIDVQNDLTKAAKKFREKTIEFEGNIIDDVNNGNYSHAAYRTLQGVVGSAPSLAVAVLPGGIGVIGAGAASQKQEELESEGQDIGVATALNATINGVAEAFFERYTARIAKGTFKSFVGKADAARQFSENIVKTILKDIGVESGSEGLTSLVQDLSDKLVSGKDISPLQIIKDVADAAIVGGAMGGGLGVPKALNGYVAKKSMAKEKQEQIDNKTAEAIRIEEQAELPEVPDELKGILKEKASKIRKEVGQISKEEINRVEKMSEEEVLSVFQIDAKILDVAERARKIHESSINDDVKESLIKDNLEEYEELRGQKEQLSKTEFQRLDAAEKKPFIDQAKEALKGRAKEAPLEPGEIESRAEEFYFEAKNNPDVASKEEIAKPEVQTPEAQEEVTPEAPEEGVESVTNKEDNSDNNSQQESVVTEEIAEAPVEKNLPQQPDPLPGQPQENVNAQDKISEIAKSKEREEFLSGTHDLPLEGLDPQFTDEVKAKITATKSNNPNEPITVGFRDGKVRILDGAHRYYEAVERGDKTIKANFAYDEGAEQFYDSNTAKSKAKKRASVKKKPEPKTETNIQEVEHNNGTFRVETDKGGKIKIFGKGGKEIKEYTSRKLKGGKTSRVKNAIYSAIYAKATGTITENQINEERKRLWDVVNDQYQPTTPEEIVEIAFANGQKVTKESVKKETGEKAKNLIWATGIKKTQNQVSVERLAEQLAEENSDLGYEDYDFRNAIINTLMTYENLESVRDALIDRYQQYNDEANSEAERQQMSAYLSSLSPEKLSLLRAAEFDEAIDALPTTEKSLLYEHEYAKQIESLPREDQERIYRSFDEAGSERILVESKGNGTGNSQESPELQENVNKIFSETPELSTIGSKSEYKEYLKSVFPESDIQGIVYHNSDSKNSTSEFSKDSNERHRLSEAQEEQKPIYFTANKDFFGSRKNKTLALLDAKNIAKGGTDITSFDDSKIRKYKERGFDSVSARQVRDPLGNVTEMVMGPDGFAIAFPNASKEEIAENRNIYESEEVVSENYEIVVFSTNQVHVLGSPSDVQGFKKFVKRNELEKEESPELREVGEQIEQAQAEVRRAETALQNKAKRLDQEILKDQEDIFGERRSQQEEKLFDERVELDKREQATAPERQALQDARENLKKLQDQRSDLMNGRGNTGAMEFAAEQDRVTPLITERIKPAKRSTNSKPRKLNEILADVAKATKATLTYSRSGRRRALGTYSPSNAHVKIRRAGDLDTAAHEIGHYLDDRFDIVGTIPSESQLAAIRSLKWFSDRGGSNPPKGLSKAQKADYLEREGLAEFVRAYVANPEQAKIIAPDLYAHFENVMDKDMLKALQKFSDDYLNWVNASYGEKISSNVESSGLKDKGKFQEWLDGFKGEDDKFSVTWMDKLSSHLLNSWRVSHKAFNFIHELNGGQPLPNSKNFELMSRVFAGINGKVNNVLGSGLINGRNETLKAEGGTFKKDSQGRIIEDGGTKMNVKWLVDILDHTSEKTLTEDMDETIRLLVAERTMEYAKKFGRFNDLTGAGAGIESDIDVAQGYLAEFESLKESNPEKYNRIKEAAERYRQFADAGLRYALDKGRLSKQKYDEIKASNEYYVSMARVQENAPMEEVLERMSEMGGKISSVKEIFHRAKGGSGFIQNPYVSLLKNTSAIIRESDRNEVMQSFIQPLKQLRNMGDGQPIDFSQIARPATTGDKNTRVIYVNGKPEKWQFEQNVFQSLTGIDDSSSNVLIDIFSALPSLIRFTVTRFPVFALRNAVRDTSARMIVSRTNSGFMDMIHNASDQDVFEMYGGSQAGFYLTDKKAYHGLMRETVKELTNKDGIVLDPRILGTKYFKLLEKGENLNRIAEFKSAYRKARKEGLDDYEAGLYAAYQARDLMDFAVAGHTMRQLNRFIPFLNAGVQGLRRSAKAIKENPAGFAARTAFYTILPTLASQAAAAAMGYEEEYEEIPAYQRDLYWNFKLFPGMPGWLTIPKPFELGLISSITDRVISKVKGSDTAFDGFTGTIANSVMPFDESSVMGGFKPIVEVSANYNFFTERPIVPYWEEGKMVELRAGTKYASRLGQTVSEGFDMVGAEVDPRKIDHILQGYGTYFANWGLSLSDIGREDSRFKFNLSKTGFARDTPISNAVSVSAVGELSKELGKTNDKRIKKLRGYIEAYYDSEDPKAQRELTKTIYEYSENLRKELLQEKAEKLTPKKEPTPEVVF